MSIIARRPRICWVVVCCATISAVASCDRREVPLASSSTKAQQQRISRPGTSFERSGIDIPDSEPVVRVKIRHIKARTQVTVSPHQGSLTLVDPVASKQATTGPLKVTRRHGRWQGLPLAFSKADMIDLHSDHAISVSQSTGKVRQYPGVIRLLAIGDKDSPDAFVVINIVPMEQYIPGVLAGELYEGWHDAAFEAQAVAARGFAVSECQQRRDHAWDVSDTQASQAYVGVPSWSQAAQCAKRTEGLLPVWRDQVLPGYFSSCCGGRAATASESIGPNPINAVAPLDGHGAPAQCQSSPMYTWTQSWNAQSLRKAIQSWGRARQDDALASLNRIQSITAVSPNAHGRPTRLEIHTTGDTATIACIDFPQILAQSGLESSRSGWVEGSVDAGDLHVQGHGFGHGVGLCQYGAEAMAASGASAKSILRFYYPGVEIKKAW